MQGVFDKIDSNKRSFVTDGILRITAREQKAGRADRLGTHDYTVSLCAFLIDRRREL